MESIFSRYRCRNINIRDIHSDTCILDGRTYVSSQPSTTVQISLTYIVTRLIYQIAATGTTCLYTTFPADNARLNSKRSDVTCDVTSQSVNFAVNGIDSIDATNGHTSVTPTMARADRCALTNYAFSH